MTHLPDTAPDVVQALGTATNSFSIIDADFCRVHLFE